MFESNYGIMIREVYKILLVRALTVIAMKLPADLDFGQTTIPPGKNRFPFLQKASNYSFVGDGLLDVCS